LTLDVCDPGGQKASERNSRLGKPDTFLQRNVEVKFSRPSSIIPRFQAFDALPLSTAIARFDATINRP
jgi:hypothetical protein